jgi:hypothetical protein
MPNIRVMSPKGDDLLAEWEPDTAVEDLNLISKRFDEQCAKGFSAFTSKSGTRLKSFSPEVEEDIIFIAPLVGG